MERAQLNKRHLVAGRPVSKIPANVKRRPMGRPRTYREGYDILARKLRLAGLSVERIADILEVCPGDLYDWVNTIPEFRQAWVEGGEVADANVAAALYHRAIGYSHDAEKISITKEGDVHRAAYIEHYPPDTGACERWLLNRQPDKWKNISQMRLTDGSDQPLQPPNIIVQVVAAAKSGS